MPIGRRQPEISGPVTGGDRGWPFAASMLDVATLGYEEQEYFISGDAFRYRQTPGTEWGHDGRWRVEPAGNAAFKTRLLVYRPRDAAQFNGTVIVTWNNVTAGYELFGTDSLEIFEGGYALVCASVQKVGIVGLPPVRQGLAAWDATRYGSLSIPSDDYSYDIFTQIGEAVGPSRDASSPDPMAGLAVARVVAQGASQSAGRVGTYYNAIAPLERAFDGFVLCIYFGRGTAIEVGDAVVNINEPGVTGDPLRGANLLRDDLDNRLFIVNSELEAISCHAVRQPDSDTLRWWEAAGMCHVSRQSSAARQLMSNRDGLVTRPTNPHINAVPITPLYDAAFFHMHRWLSDGIAPPIQPRIVFNEEQPPSVVRDADGIAIGGIRLPQVQVPLAHNSAISLGQDIYSYLGGCSRPFTATEARRRYGTRDAFLAQFEQAARAAVDAGVLRPREIERLTREAAAVWPD